MGWWNKLVQRHNGTAKCLICEKGVPKDAAVIEYKYDGGIGKAFLCEKCETEMNTPKMDLDDDFTI